MMETRDGKIALNFIEEKLPPCRRSLVSAEYAYSEYESYCLKNSYNCFTEDKFLEGLEIVGIKTEKENGVLYLLDTKIIDRDNPENIITPYTVSKFCEDYLHFKKDKVVSIDKAFTIYTSFYDMDRTSENLNAFIVEFLKGGHEVANLDGVLFFYDLTWKEVK